MAPRTKKSASGIHRLASLLVVILAFCCMAVIGSDENHHGRSRKLPVYDATERYDSMYSKTNGITTKRANLAAAEIKRTSRSSAAAAAVDVAFNNQEDARIQASVALCEKAGLEHVADQGSREDWECSKKEFIEKVCDDKYLPLIRTVPLEQARLANADWKFCVESRWSGRCSGGPTGDALRQVIRCKACFYFNVPMSYQYLRPPPIVGPLNNYVSSYCPSFSKNSMEPVKPAPQIRNDPVVMPNPVTSATADTSCEDVCKDSGRTILMAGMCWYLPLPPQRKDGKNRRLCQWPTKEQNQICLQARNKICARNDMVELVRLSWYGSSNKFSRYIYRTAMEERRARDKSRQNKGNDNSGIYRRALAAVDSVCNSICTKA